MKKLLALFLAFALILSMCACTGAPPAGNTNVPNPSPGGTPDSTPADEIGGDLLIWIGDEGHAKALIEAFHVKYPNVNVQYEIVGLEAPQMLSLDGPAGNGPDVIQFAHDGASLAVADGNVEPLPADIQARIEDLVTEAAVNTIKYDGKVYGVPFQMDNVALFYNKDLYPNPPKSFEEIIAFAKTYNEPAIGKYAMRVAPNNFFGYYGFFTAFGYSIFGPNNDDWKNPGFDSSEFAQGLTFFQSLREINDVNAADATADAVYGAFDRGEVPFIINGPWQLQSAKAGGVNFGVTKIPTINGVQPGCFSGVQVACVSSYSKNLEAAFVFAEFMSSVEGARVLYETQGVLPALKDVSVVPGLADDEILRGFAEQSPYAVPTPMITEMALVWFPVIPVMELVWDGKLTVEEAQAKVMEDYELALNGAGKSMYD